MVILNFSAAILYRSILQTSSLDGFSLLIPFETVYQSVDGGGYCLNCLVARSQKTQFG